MRASLFVAIPWWVLPVFTGLCPAAEPHQPPSSRVALTPAFVDGLIAEAENRPPVIAAAEARADSAAAAVQGVRTWEDPIFTVGLSLPTARGIKPSEEGNLTYGVEQKLPTFNRPKLARAAAEADATKEKLNVAFESARLRRDLVVGLVTLALNDIAVDLGQQDLDWLSATLDAVDHRYRVAKASQIDWLKIQTEKAKALDRLRTLNLEREHQQVAVNRLLNRDLHAAWPPVELPPLHAPVAYSDGLIDAAVRGEPKLRVMQQEVVQAEARAQLTRQQRKPEFGVGFQGRSYSGDAGFREGLVTVNFTLPWLNDRAYRGDFQRDRAKMRASEHDAADYTLTLREELHHLIVELDAARRQAILYRDELIPLTEQTLSSASAAWANNLGLFQDLLDARRMLVDHRLMFAQALAEQTRKLAEISFRTGANDLTPFSGAEPMPASFMAMPGQTK